MQAFPRIIGLLIGLPAVATAGELSFNREIRPILADRCFNCHGADEKSREADLRLDVPESATDPKLGAIVPGKPDESELIYRIFETDPDEVMPPPDHPVQLTDAEKATLKQWIAEGAKYEGHWAFTRAERSQPRGPATIDRLIDERLKAEQLQREPEAPRETLIRRLSLDLAGVPPTVEEIDAFLADRSPDAYERLVDRLLASPRYGERMAMWWLAGHIRPVARVAAQLLQTRNLAPGEAVGYNATFIAPTHMRVGTVSIGYADGLLRARGPGNALFHEGRALPILGKVSMDMVVVDLTAAPDLVAGDWLEVPWNVADAAQQNALSAYELLTTIGPRLRPR